MNRKEYDTPKGKAVFDYDDNGVGRITLECMDMLMDMIASSMWIPCSERLPTLSEDGTSEAVLLCWSDGQVTVGAYQGNRTFCGQAWPEAKDCRVTVVAWMPLPKPYGEREGE